MNRFANIQKGKEQWSNQYVNRIEKDDHRQWSNNKVESDGFIYNGDNIRFKVTLSHRDNRAYFYSVTKQVRS